MAVVGVMLLAVSAAVGCGTGEAPAGESAEPSGVITVSAAASLAGAFTRIGASVEASFPNTEVRFNFDSSARLATQIDDGAPADVFASADPQTVERLVADGLVERSPKVFARNTLVLVTVPGNPHGIERLADLDRVGIISLCGTSAPCGQYAEQALESADVSVPERSITRGANATATLRAVAEGDAVAGVVYASDAVGAGDAVEIIDIPAANNVVAGYPIAVLSSSDNRALADAFVDAVTGSTGQAVLKEFGFLPAA